MKTLQLLFLAVFTIVSGSLLAQTQKTETFNVSGNCGMCKKTIEKAATEAGATSATWDKTTKMLTVNFSPDGSSTTKIQQKIADAGYDNEGVKATDAAYNKLHGCCKYERKANKGGNDADCCSKKGKGEECKKDGKMGADCCSKDAKAAKKSVKKAA